jgi:hypothetical protein
MSSLYRGRDPTTTCLSILCACRVDAQQAPHVGAVNTLQTWSMSEPVVVSAIAALHTLTLLLCERCA